MLPVRPETGRCLASGVCGACSPRSAGQGLALAASLLLLLLLSLVTAAGLRLSQFELRLAYNDEVLATVMQEAQSRIDQVLRMGLDFHDLAAGASRCVNGQFNIRFNGACPGSNPLPDPGWAGPGTANLAVMRHPRQAPPPIGSGFSADRFQTTRIRLVSIFDGASDALGTAQLHEELALVVPAPAVVSGR